MRVWRDEARGIFRPRATSGDEEDAEDQDANAQDAGRSHEEDDEVRVTSRADAVPSTALRTSSPDPDRPKKSYFDNIPTSSPGGALERDEEMADRPLDESDGEERAVRNEGADVFGGVAGASRLRNATSEVGFNDEDIGFDFDEEPRDDGDDEDMAALMEMEREQTETAVRAPATDVPLDGQETREDNLDDFDFGEEEEDIMREMENAARLDEGRYESRKEASSIYAAKRIFSPMLEEAARPADIFIKTLEVAAPPEAEHDRGDLDYDAEDEVVRGLERSPVDQGQIGPDQALSSSAEVPRAICTALSKTGSTSTSSSYPGLEFDFPDEPEKENELSESAEAVHVVYTHTAPAVQQLQEKQAELSPVKIVWPQIDDSMLEEEEDLYAP